jgi:hypothetical protein
MRLPTKEITGLATYVLTPAAQRSTRNRGSKASGSAAFTIDPQPKRHLHPCP